MLKEDLALDTLYLSWACQLHRDLLPSSIPRLLQAVASDIVSGGIPGLVLCLGTKVAKEALKVLATLLLHADLPAEQVDATESSQQPAHVLWPSQVALQKLQHALSHLPFCLAASHMPNMELDVCSLIRLSFLEGLQHLDSMQDSDNPMLAFLMALMTRLGRQPSLLWLGSDGQPSPRQTYAPHAHRVCQGCANCKGADSLLKTQIVVLLWAIFCSEASGACVGRLASAI
ncbi:TPA: hypothetical protein ACH3X2_001066 [Trebouxia sp. C0005]